MNTKEGTHSFCHFLIHSSDNGLSLHYVRLPLMFLIQTMCEPFICVFFRDTCSMLQKRVGKKTKMRKIKTNGKKEATHHKDLRMNEQAFSFWSLSLVLGSVRFHLQFFFLLHSLPLTHVHLLQWFVCLSLIFAYLSSPLPFSLLLHQLQTNAVL